MKYYRAQLLVSAILLLSGCDNERTDPDRTECDSPPASKVGKRTQTAAPQSQPVSVSKQREAEEVEALKRDIEDLRRRLKAQSAKNEAPWHPVPLSLSESLSQT